MNVKIDQVHEAVLQTERAVSGLYACVQRPALVDLSGHPFYRHQDPDDLLLSYLKCVRAVSSLNAAILLLEAGYVFEVHTLCRCIDECSLDVWFFAEPDGEGGAPSENQQRAFEEFFQEEWSDLNDIIHSQQARNRVARDKVRARVARGIDPDPSGFQAVVKVIDRGFSGFVHSSYVHIMELFGGPQNGFHLRGMLGTPRIDECVESLASATLRLMCALELVAARFAATGDCGHARQVFEDLRAARQHFFAIGELGGSGATA